MENKRILALGVVIAVGMGQTGFAASDGTADSKPDSGNMSGMTMGDGETQMVMMGGDMMPMMQRMMKLHASVGSILYRSTFV